MAQNSNLCSNCKNPLSFKPRVDVDLRLDPSTSRSFEIQEIISLCNEDLDDYDAQILRLQNEILDLQARKKRLRDYKTLVQSSLSLFRKLPNEILCIIFESACAENLLQDPWPPIHTDCFLPAIAYLQSLALSAVCTWWRSLALTSPRLWSQLRLEIRRSEKELASWFVSTLRLYLNRSVDAPLSIIVVAQENDYRISPALDLLLDHADRWRTFAYAGDYELAELIGPDLSFPILENLTLEGLSITMRSLKSFEDAPKLIIVAIEGHIDDLPQSWNQITSLQLLKPPLPQAMIYLQRYPHLTNLTLPGPSDEFGKGITSLARLESFTFVEFPYEQQLTLLTDMFSTMTLPSLTDLFIDSDNHEPHLYWPELDVFSSFISRSMCTLTTLSLRRVRISDEFLIAAFRILPSLINFCINDWVGPPTSSILGVRFRVRFGVPSPLSKHLILSLSASSPTPILPKLRSLSIMTYDPSFDDAAFVDMVSSRWLPGSSAAAIGMDCLRSLVLHLRARDVDEETYRSLENLDRMGLQVVVTGNRSFNGYLQ